MKSIVEIPKEVVKSLSYKHGYINYIFGDDVYINSILTTFSKSPKTSDLKFPLIALFTPISEDRSNKKYASVAPVSLLFAINTKSSYTNEERLEYSFKRTLIPLYECFLSELKKHPNIELAYDEEIPHNYTENYSYGSRGAFDSQNKKLDDLIDAINISNLVINVKKEICYGARY